MNEEDEDKQVENEDELGDNELLEDEDFDLVEIVLISTQEWTPWKVRTHGDTGRFWIILNRKKYD